MKINKASLYTFQIMSDIHDLNEGEKEKKIMYFKARVLTIMLKLI